MFTRIVRTILGASVALTAAAVPARAQHVHSTDMPAESPGWHFIQDSLVLGIFNQQGGPRGGDEFKVPNWWMGILSRKVKASELTFNTMLSLDPATVGNAGYREIFQVSESLDGRPRIDHLTTAPVGPGEPSP